MVAQMMAVIAVLAQTTTSSSQDSVPIIGYYVGNMIIGGVVGFFIGNWRNRPVLGIVLGALLGCIGWIITAVLSKKRPYSSL